MANPINPNQNPQEISANPEKAKLEVGLKKLDVEGVAKERFDKTVSFKTKLNPARLSTKTSKELAVVVARTSSTAKKVLGL